MNGQELTIVGVAPKGFQGTILRLMFDFWLPATLATALFAGSRELDDRSIRSYSVLGRAGVPGQRCRRAGRGDVGDAASGAGRSRKPTRRSKPTSCRSGSRRAGRSVCSRRRWSCQLIILLLLLAVCGNTANLVLARASARQQEMGVRLSLGARPWRIAQPAPYRKPRACPGRRRIGSGASPSGERAR